MKIFTAIEDAHNKLADLDLIWFPFTFLRPAKNQSITLLIKLKMTLAFGSFFYLVYALKNILMGKEFTLISSLEVLLVSYGVFFIHFTMITAFFWNRRAKKMNHQS